MNVEVIESAYVVIIGSSCISQKLERNETSIIIGSNRSLIDLY